jgi:16S rRNA (cytidine1402-2'-O)-methyltransferase
VKRQKSFTENKAILYLVSTPIGNLQDMTYRAVETLKSVTKIFCEDTRTSKVLLQHYEIKTPVASYHDHNKEQAAKQILKHLREGRSIALISDAGTPLISDPGYHIVNLAIKEEFPVVPIPGASALLSALVGSGFPPHPFLFVGFLDAKTSKREQKLTSIKDLPYPIVFYESPHRLNKAIESLYKILGERDLVIARELTKLHEEFIRGTTKSLQNLKQVKGEIVLIVSGNAEHEEILDEDIIKSINNYIEQGYTTKDAIILIAKEANRSKNEIYQLYHLNNKE